MTTRRPPAPAALLALAALAVLLLHTQLGDYDLVPSDDNPGPIIDALARGDLGRAADVVPAMGLTSILLRVPAAVVGGADLPWTYGLGALLCLLPGIVLAARLDGRLAARGRTPAARLLTGGLLVAGPAVFFALDRGHPEELLAGTLCVAAVLEAERGRTLAGAVLLGLAIGTKQWALVATFPVLLAVGAGAPGLITGARVRAALIAAGVSLVCIAPLIAMNPERYRAVGQSLASAKRAYPQTLAWPLAERSTETIAVGAGEQVRVTVWQAPLGITRGPAIALTLLLGLVLVPFARGQVGGLPGLADPMALLAVLLVARCLLDPMNLDYYAAPALTALAVWEARRAPSGSPALPLASIAAAAGSFVVWRSLTDAAAALQWFAWLAATLPILGVAAVRPRPADRPPAGAGTPAAP